MKKQKSLKSFEKFNKTPKKLNKKSMQTVKGDTRGDSSFGDKNSSSVIIEQDTEN